MKTTFSMIAIASILSLSACGQTGQDVPANIKTAFAQKFPNATKVNWGKETEKEWEAEFKMDGKEYSANYDNNGTWMETEYEISVKEIPTAVQNTIDKEFPGYKTGESEISETTGGKQFEFSLKKEGTTLEVAIDISGTVTKKEQAGKDKNEDDED